MKSMLRIQSLLLALIFITAIAGCSGGSKIKNEANPNVRLNINKPASEGVDEKIVTRVAEKIYEKLREEKGSIILYREKDGISKSANRQLAGRISILGKKYILTIKVVEGEKGQLLYNRTITVLEGDLDSELEDIAEEISGNDDIWK